MPRDFPWTLDVIIDDYARLMDSLGVQRFHLVGAKIGGIIARAFAARRPERVATLTVVGSPPPLRQGAEHVPALTEEFETRGVEHWARRTMAGRLGDGFPADGVEWWIRFMGRTPVSTIVGFNAAINYSDIRADLPKIGCPTLVITTDGSGLASVEETRAWQQAIAGSELLVIPGNSFHVAASDAERCAQATLDFIGRRVRGT
jgi:pimeloyl-ACP methyl ester carboxylesterase